MQSSASLPVLALFNGPCFSCCIDEEHSSDIGSSRGERRVVTAFAAMMPVESTHAPTPNRNQEHL